jgi:hypothetical protein
MEGRKRHEEHLAAALVFVCTGKNQRLEKDTGNKYKK